MCHGETVAVVSLVPEQVRAIHRGEIALVYLQQQTQMTNRDYRRLNHVDGIVAGEELRGLVQTGLVEQNGAGRWTYYTLKMAEESVKLILQPEVEQILSYVQNHGAITNAECRELLKVDETRAYYLMNKLTESGILRPKGKGRWRVYVLS